MNLNQKIVFAYVFSGHLQPATCIRLESLDKKLEFPRYFDHWISATRTTRNRIVGSRCYHLPTPINRLTVCCKMRIVIQKPTNYTKSENIFVPLSFLCALSLKMNAMNAMNGNCAYPENVNYWHFGFFFYLTGRWKTKRKRARTRIQPSRTEDKKREKCEWKWWGQRKKRLRKLWLLTTWRVQYE